MYLQTLKKIATRNIKNKGDGTDKIRKQRHRKKYKKKNKLIPCYLKN